jgi:hypothetical protein
MNARARRATSDYSKGDRVSRAAPGVLALRLLLALAGFAGAVLLAISTFTAVIEIRVVTVVQDSISGYERHSVALLVVAVFAAAMVAGGLRGARPAMVALGACGLAVVLIALLGDLPDKGETGRLGSLYEDARAETGIGFYLETLGGVLLLLSGGGMLLLAGAAPREAQQRPRPQAPVADEPA